MITGPDGLCYADFSSGEEVDCVLRDPLGKMAVGLAPPYSTKT